ncbi:MAG: hypothetical protein Q4A74_00405 [Cardiobacteriaceae bacterium]|nr:hypothetical protein [Cardiobacteriaceae bacterium]
MSDLVKNRRPIAARHSRWATWLAGWLATKPFVTPNGISVCSAIFAAGAAALLLLGGSLSLVFGALGIQLRLVCNLLDGMVALEGEKKQQVALFIMNFPIVLLIVFCC